VWHPHVKWAIKDYIFEEEYMQRRHLSSGSVPYIFDFL
jgi:hypothetical protein